MLTESKNKRISIITLGCSKNLVDSEKLMGQISRYNSNIVHNTDIDYSDTLIINTCGFIGDAKQESIDTILKYIKQKQEGKIKRLIVMGCLSQRYKNELIEELPEVDAFFGVDDMSSILKYIDHNYSQCSDSKRLISTPNHYAYLKISEGCNRKCAFCAIPLIRGSLNSVPGKALIDEAKKLVDQGVKELILIAQDLTSYGKDISGRSEISRLLERLSDIKGLEWIRLHYAYPAGFPKDLIKVMRDRDNICKYLDIPFQHSNENMLRFMRRGHTNVNDRKLIELLRMEMPDIVLRTTLLTGFPGEGEKEFNDLLDFVSEMRFNRLGVFAYSEEEGTYAANKYTDEVDESVKRERLEAIMKRQMVISKELNNNYINKSIKVLIDDRAGEYYHGRTEGDSPEVDNMVHIPAKEGNLITGNFYNIRINSAGPYDMYGSVEQS